MDTSPTPPPLYASIPTWARATAVVLGVLMLGMVAVVGMALIRDPTGLGWFWAFLPFESLMAALFLYAGASGHDLPFGVAYQAIPGELTRRALKGDLNALLEYLDRSNSYLDQLRPHALRDRRVARRLRDQSLTGFVAITSVLVRLASSPDTVPGAPSDRQELQSLMEKLIRQGDSLRNEYLMAADFLKAGITF